MDCQVQMLGSLYYLWRGGLGGGWWFGKLVGGKELAPPSLFENIWEKSPPPT